MRDLKRVQNWSERIYVSPDRPSRRGNWLRRLVLAATLALALQASPRDGTQVIAAKAPAKAWFDAKNVCVLPLHSKHLPINGDELSASLLTAYRASLEFPDSQNVVHFTGLRYPALDSLTINLSDATVHPGPRVDKEKTKPNNKPVGRLGVDHFQLRGEPLLCDRAKLNLNLSAADAHLYFERDRRGKPILLLADAREGELNFAASTGDLERLLLATARESAGPYGLSIESASLKIEARTPHSVTARLHVATRFGFIPAGMAFKAHVEIDNAMNARLTGLTCDGDDVLGPLIVNFLRPGLAKYEGISRPLVSFPSPAMRLRDVGVTVDDQIHLHAAFGR